MVERTVHVTTPFNERIIIQSVPDQVTAEVFARVLSASGVRGSSGIIRIVDPTGWILEPSDHVLGTEISFISEPDPLRRFHVFTTVIFWAVHLLPAILWLNGSPAKICFYLYFLGAVLLLLLGRWLPSVAITFPWDLHSRGFVRQVQLFISLLSPYFDAPLLHRDGPPEVFQFG
jgi:hypothetical protein